MQYAKLSSNRKALPPTLQRSEDENLTATATPENIVALQRVIGNKAVQAAVQQGRVTMQGGLSLQRKEGHNCGGRCPMCQPALTGPRSLQRAWGDWGDSEQTNTEENAPTDQQTNSGEQATGDNQWFADWSIGQTPAAQQNTPTQNDVMGWVAPNLEAMGLGEFGGLPGSEPLNQNASGAQASQTTINVKNNTYTLHGKNAAELSQDISSHANPEVGSILVTPSVTTQTLDDKVVSAQVTIDIEKKMPTWAERDSVQCPGLVKEWDRWYGALDAHENGHLAIDKTGHANIHQVYIGKTEDAGEAAFEAKRTAIEKLHTAFHGTPVGANPSFDGGIPCP